MKIRRDVAAFSLAAALLVAGGPAPALADQQVRVPDDAREAYFRAVAEFFAMPESEISILGEWRMPAEEIPVVLFLAHRAGVSPEALVALRRSGRSWSELAGRYRLDAAQFYVPIPDRASAGVLQPVYDRYRSVPTPSWSDVALSDREIVSLVNLRVLSQTLHLAPERVLAAAGGAESWVDVYDRLLRRPGSRQEEPAS